MRSLFAVKMVQKLNVNVLPETVCTWRTDDVR